MLHSNKSKSEDDQLTILSQKLSDKNIYGKYFVYLYITKAEMVTQNFILITAILK